MKKNIATKPVLGEVKSKKAMKNRKEMEYITGSKLVVKNKKPSKQSKRTEHRTNWKKKCVGFYFLFCLTVSI